jgi:hypothetical protein
MNNNSITNVKEPQSDNDVITKGFVTNLRDELSNQLILDVKREVENASETLQEKISKKLSVDGDVLMGDLDMNNNSITNVKEPQSDNDVITKGYVTTFFDNLSKQLTMSIENNVHNAINLLQQNIDNKVSVAGDVMRGDLLMDWRNISNVKFPVDRQDAVNKLYVHISSQNDDVDVGKLLEIAQILKIVCDDSTQNVIVERFRPHFNLQLQYATNMLTMYNNVYDNNIRDIKECVFFTDLRVHLLNLVEALPETMLIDFKTKLMEKKFVNTPENGSLGKRYRRVINKAAKKLDPQRHNKEIELL